MADESNYSLVKDVLLLVFGASGWALKAVEYLANRSKIRAEAKVLDATAQHTSVTSNVSTLTVSDALLRQWMQDASDGAKELQKVRRELSTAQITIDRLADKLLESINLMRDAADGSIEGFAEFETDVRLILSTVTGGGNGQENQTP